MVAGSIDLWPSAAIIGVGNESQLRRLKPALARRAEEHLHELEAAASGVTAEAPATAASLSGVHAVVTPHGEARRTPDLRVEVLITAEGRSLQVRSVCGLHLDAYTCMRGSATHSYAHHDNWPVHRPPARVCRRLPTA